MCFIEVCCSIYNSEKYCCFFINSKGALKYLHLIDFIELIINIALIYFYLTKDLSITYVPWILLLFGNLISLTLRILGALLRGCGAFRLWTRQAMFCSRLWAILF